MKVIDVSIADLKPYKDNVKRHPQKQIDLLAKNIKRFGFTTPLLIDKDNNVIAGHGRLLALQKLQTEQAPCVRMEGLSEKEIKALRIVDNKIAEMADWEMDALRSELIELDESLFDLTGFDKDFMIVDDEKDDVVPENVPAIVQKGEIWQLGDHYVMCGDSTNSEDVQKLMHGTMSSLVFTSPPYNVGISYATHDDNQSHSQYLNLLQSVMKNLPLVAGGAVAWNVGVSPKTWFWQQIALFEAAGYTLLRQIAWVKTGIPKPVWQNTTRKPLARHYIPNYCHEAIYLFSKGELQYGETITPDDDFSSDVWEVSTAGDTEAKHPASFPVKLALGVIKHMSAVGEGVHDPFLGSGSTLIACEKSGRKCTGMELDPKYCDMAIARWETFTGKKAVKI